MLRSLKNVRRSGFVIRRKRHLKIKAESSKEVGKKTFDVQRKIRSLTLKIERYLIINKDKNLKSQGNFDRGTKRGKEGKRHEARGGSGKKSAQSSKLKVQRGSKKVRSWEKKK